MRPRVRPLLALVLLAGASPSMAGGFTCPDRGGPAWREVRTTHVVLLTDLSSGDAQALAREVERVYVAVRGALFKSPPPTTGTVRAVALRNPTEFDLFAPKEVAAFFRSQTGAGPTIVLPGQFLEAQRYILAHELTHQVAAGLFARQPWWFAEGLASFMETVGASGPGSTPTIGGVPLQRYRSAMPYHGGLGPVVEGKAPREARQYGLAWALVHYLVHRMPAELGQIQARLARGQDPAVAWREVFPQWDPATPAGAKALDEEVGRYIGTMKKVTVRGLALPPEEPVTERPLSAADAHAIRLSLLPWFNRGEKLERGVVRAEVDEALTHDPGQVQALAVLAGLEPARALEYAERAVAAHPEDARAWLRLAGRLPETAAERRLEALQKAVALDPSNAEALNSDAWTLLGAGRSGEALPLARAAVTREPWNPAYLDTLSGVLQDLGQCPAALGLERRAVDLLSETPSQEARKPFFDRIAELEKQCGGGPDLAAPVAPSAAPPGAIPR
jgi:tetratricopeptide (TPR) repeat protein